MFEDLRIVDDESGLKFLVVNIKQIYVLIDSYHIFANLQSEIINQRIVNIPHIKGKIITYPNNSIIPPYLHLEQPELADNAIITAKFTLNDVDYEIDVIDFDMFKKWLDIDIPAIGKYLTSIKVLMAYINENCM